MSYPHLRTPEDVLASPYPLCLRPADDAQLCACVWDDTQELYEPLRAVLRDVAGLFPAAMQPYLQVRGWCSARW